MSDNIATLVDVIKQFSAYKSGISDKLDVAKSDYAVLMPVQTAAVSELGEVLSYSDAETVQVILKLSDAMVGKIFHHGKMSDIHVQMDEATGGLHIVGDKEAVKAFLQEVQLSLDIDAGAQFNIFVKVIDSYTQQTEEFKIDNFHPEGDVFSGRILHKKVDGFEEVVRAQHTENDAVSIEVADASDDAGLLDLAVKSEDDIAPRRIDIEKTKDINGHSKKDEDDASNGKKDKNKDKDKDKEEVAEEEVAEEEVAEEEVAEEEVLEEEVAEEEVLEEEVLEEEVAEEEVAEEEVAEEEVAEEEVLEEEVLEEEVLEEEVAEEEIAEEEIAEVVVKGTKGNDTIEGSNDTSDIVKAREGDDLISGGDHGDKLYGGAGDDSLYGDNGADRLYGGNGDDLLHGHSGDDLVVGGNGDDSLYGDTGSDTLKGGNGDDIMEGNSGDDVMSGGAAEDTLSGNEGNDTLKGDNGDDILYGGENNDTLVGGNGNDSLYGDAGHDRLFGGNNDDALRGGQGDDFLNGGNGNDTIVADGGNDTLKGGNGDDVFVLTDADAVVHIRDMNEGDMIAFDSESFVFPEMDDDGLITLWEAGMIDGGFDESVTSHFIYHAQEGELWYDADAGASDFDADIIAIVDNAKKYDFGADDFSVWS